MSKLPKEKGRLAKLLSTLKILKVEYTGRRKANRIYICEMAKYGCNIAIIKKKPDTYFRDGNSYNEAIAKGSLCWMIDDYMIPIMANAHHVKYMLFYTDICEDIYISNMSDWLDRDSLYIPQNFNTKSFRNNNSPMKYLSITKMKKSPGSRSIVVR